MVDTVKEVLCYREKDEMQTKRASLAEKESDSPLPNYLSHITPYQPQQSLRDYWGWGINLIFMIHRVYTKLKIKAAFLLPVMQL